MLEGDTAGREAQTEIIGRLARRLYVRAVDLPEGASPTPSPKKQPAPEN
jgi:hypothetical protein